MVVPYRHTQMGYALVTSLVVGMLVVTSATLTLGPQSAVLWTVVPLMGLAVLVLPSLTTEVDEQRVRCHFGAGLIRRDIALREIADVAIVRPHWIYGWGLRLVPGGWLWRVSGLSAVQLRLRSGKLFQIGTDDADGLSRAISSALTAG